MNFHFIRRNPDGSEELSDMEMGLEYAHTGLTIASSEAGKVWRVVEIRFATNPPTMIAVHVDEF